MIRTRVEACRILGLSVNATDAQIKAAYKDLVKKTHPDATGTKDSSYYNLVIEAYRFLINDNSTAENKVMESMKPTVTRTGGVWGGSQFRNTASNSDYAAFQKRIKKQKAREFEKKQKDYKEKLDKQDADYKRAMDAIDAIRVARAIQAMIWANGMGKDEGNDKNS